MCESMRVREVPVSTRKVRSFSGPIEPFATTRYPSLSLTGIDVGPGSWAHAAKTVIPANRRQSRIVQVPSFIGHPLVCREHGAVLREDQWTEACFGLY